MRFVILLLAAGASFSLSATASSAEPRANTDRHSVDGIRMIDATKLTVAELMALANAERRNPGPLSCCDWSGGNCLDAHEFRKTSVTPVGFDPD